MFGSTEKSKIDHFLEIASFIVKSDPNGLTVTQKKALSTIAEKLSKESLESSSDLLQALTKKRASTRSTKSKKPPMDPSLLKAILQKLDAVAADRSSFEETVDKLNKAHTAPELKKIVASFAAGARPKTKADAVRILKAERNDRERAKEKAAEAGRTTPW